jgi:hypothetical protein
MCATNIASSTELPIEAQNPPVVDHRRADPRHGRMHEQDRAAPIHLGVDRLELRFGD